MYDNAMRYLLRLHYTAIKQPVEGHHRHRYRHQIVTRKWQWKMARQADHTDQIGRAVYTDHIDHKDHIDSGKQII